jgi:hypothetical protein
MLMAQGQFVEALPLVRADHLLKTSPRASFALANIYLNLGLEDAVKTTLGEMSYVPLAEPLTRVILSNMKGDDVGSLRLAESEIERTHDALWRPLVILMAIKIGELDTARRHLLAAEPTLLGPNPDVAHAQVDNAFFAAMLLAREGKKATSDAILEKVLALNAPPESGYDAPANKIVRAKALALLGRDDRAIAELKSAQLQGFRSLWDFDNFVRIDRMPMFERIRDDPRFIAFVAEIQADNDRMREAVLANPLRGTDSG